MTRSFPFASLFGAAVLAVLVLPVHADQIASMGQRAGGPLPAPPPIPIGTSSIAGHVVDGDSDRAMTGAIVSMNGSAAAASGASAAGPNNGPQNVGISPGRLVTDGSGHFGYTDLPAGHYNFNVQIPGYTGGGYGQTRAGGSSQTLELGDGQHLDVKLKVWRLASISGRVTDEAGDPVVNQQVRLLRRDTSTGVPRFQMSGGGQTDDRGDYRMHDLMPGDYLVVVPNTQSSVPMATMDLYGNGGRQTAAGRAMIQSVQQALNSTRAPMPNANNSVQVGGEMTTLGRGETPPMPGADGRMLAYATLFYPSASSVSRATAVSVNAGDDRTGIDLQIALVPMLHVSGTVTGANGPASSLGLRLVQVDEAFENAPDFDAATTVTDPAGNFEFVAVPPGDYVLRGVEAPPPAPRGQAPPIPLISGAAGGRMTLTLPAPPVNTPPTYFAEMPLTVSDRDVDGVGVTLRSGLRISGRVSFDGTSPPPTADQLQRITVTIVSTSTSANGLGPGRVMPVRVGPDGLFITPPSYVPGKYRIMANGPGLQPWTLRAAMVNGHDASDVPIEISTGDLSGVTLTFVDTSTQLTGVARGTAGDANTTAMVVIFPSDRNYWTSGGTRCIRNSRVSTSGAFTMNGLPPGDYLIAAVSEEYSAQVHDPTFLDSVSRVATHVQLRAGDKQTENLTMVTIPIR